MRSLTLPRLALLWAGVVIGCSFIATPAKFKAPSLNLPTALEVGRVTFRSLVVAELVLCFIGVVVLWRGRAMQPLFAGAIAVLAVQWLAVMPLLNAHTDAVVQGRSPEGPPWHIAYVVLEAAKVLLLLAVAFRGEADAHQTGV
jgi:hypothetical protein